MKTRKITLEEHEIPDKWYNIIADMPNKPLPPLNHFIQGYWQIESGGQPQLLELVPDGYPEIVFLLKNNIRRNTNGGGGFAVSTRRYHRSIDKNSELFFVN